ncbi:MAG: TetR/AcrR family transcriptional regulator [Chloroflexota bacterium]|nr:TetR/AcrR family transcriptional regulator [Chloroflexota bacterium]
MAPTTASPRARNRQGEGPRLRDELMMAAERLLASGADVATLSLRAVAREAGIAAPSVYLHFDSKDALLYAVIEDHFAKLDWAIVAGLELGTEPATRLLAGCLAYCRYAVEQPGSYRILFNTPRSGLPVSGFAGTLGEAAFRTLVDGVAACIGAGVAQPGDPFRIATDVWSALHGAVSLRWATSGFPWPPLEQQVRGILEAFTGIPYAESSSGEELASDGAT